MMVSCSPFHFKINQQQAGAETIVQFAALPSQKLMLTSGSSFTVGVLHTGGEGCGCP